MYLSTVFVFAVLLSAVLGLVLDSQSTWTWQVLSQVLLYVFVIYLALSQELENMATVKMTACLLLFFSMLCLSMNR